MSSNLPEPVAHLLAAVVEALDIPHPATAGDSEKHGEVLADRVMHAVIALRGTLEGHPLGIEWTTDYLRERLAEHPPIGYRAAGSPRPQAAPTDDEPLLDHPQFVELPDGGTLMRTYARTDEDGSQE
ncbi:hypothetical protein [Streptomyces sp. NPDC000880]